MKSTKKLTLLLLTFVMVFALFAGCSTTNKSTKDDEIKKEVVVDENNPIVITDQLGREVKLTKIPEKIVSSYYISTSLLINLGVKDKLVGIEAKANEREMYKKVAPELVNLPAVGNSKNINVEEILNLGAELVIIPTRLKDFIPQFEKLNIPVLAIEPETLDGFMESVKIISKAVGKEDKGNKLVKYYEDTTDKVAKLTKKVDKKANVYIAGSDSVLTTCTSKMYQNYLIEACGANNVTSSLTDGYWTTISVEELIKDNPDKIFIVGYASYSVDDILNDSRLQDINAVKNKEVYIFPSKLEAWDYPTPSSTLGMLWLVNNLYPNVYSKEDYKKDAISFYKDFYNIDVTEEEIGL